MNASQHHSKVKVTLTLGQSTFVAGEHVAGKVEIECRADKGLGIGVIMVELFGIEGTFIPSLLTAEHLGLTLQSRADLTRSFGDLYLHSRSTSLPGPWPTALKCRPAVSVRW
jgi:hypothetical protein